MDDELVAGTAAVFFESVGLCAEELRRLADCSWLGDAVLRPELITGFLSCELEGFHGVEELE